MTDKLLREAAQNILNGIETRAIRIETKQDETWANALSQLRAALAEAQQGEGDGPALKCPNPDCMGGYITADVGSNGETRTDDCPTCHGEKP
jgi:hypothetical protein